MSKTQKDIIERFNENGNISFINTKGVETSKQPSDPLKDIIETHNEDGSISFVYRGYIMNEEPTHNVVPQVELPPYNVFFPPPRHPYYLEQRKRYYESHNYLCKDLSPNREFAFIYHLQQYQPPRDLRSGFEGTLGLPPHENQNEQN